MVNVTVYKDGFMATGHADYNEYGKDIVCSAISAVVQTTLLGLQCFCKTYSNTKSGDVDVYVQKPNQKSRLLLDTMVIGLKEIEKEHPMNINVKEEYYE
jgi:uncharacterized protein YsxB (DUF464 family)